MIIKEKEKELEYFKSAKKYFNSSTKEYEKSLEELNKISLLLKNISVIHMKTLCLLMLSKYEDIVEFYYIHRNHIDSIFNEKNNNNENEVNETKKIISIAFFNLGMKQKAKSICPEIKDDYKIESFQIEIIGIISENKMTKLNSNRMNKKIILKNIKQNLEEKIEKNKEEEAKNEIENENINNNLNNSKELMPISAEFVDDIIKSSIKMNKMKSLYQMPLKDEIFEKDENDENFNTKSENSEKMNGNEINEKEENDEKGGLMDKNESEISNISKKSNNSSIYNKLKEDLIMNDMNTLKKENGLFMTFEDKIKEINIEKEKNKDENEKDKENGNKENQKNEDKNIENNDTKKIIKKKNEKVKSNRSEKQINQKEIKGPLNIQKSPYAKKKLVKMFP